MNIKKIQYQWPIIINKRLFANLTTDPLLGRQLKALHLLTTRAHFSDKLQICKYSSRVGSDGVYNPKTLWKKEWVGAGGRDEIKLLKP
jgi:hypothetical protein